MNIKLIVTDLDNTLLRRDKTISEYTVRSFRRLRERGILAAFATARDFRFVTEHISPLFHIIPDIVIADNGALARHNDIDLYKKLIPVQATNVLLSRFDMLRSVSTEKTYYLSDLLSDGYANDHWSIGKIDTIITDFRGGLKDDALYIDGYADGSLEYITKGIPDIRTVTYSDVRLVTVVHREATKQNALTAVRNALKIEDGDFAVFGDDYSDIELLSSCTHGVAVANAIDECKNKARYICGDCDNDGVAKWLEENVLSN